MEKGMTKVLPYPSWAAPPIARSSTHSQKCCVPWLTITVISKAREKATRLVSGSGVACMLLTYLWTAHAAASWPPREQPAAQPRRRVGIIPQLPVLYLDLGFHVYLGPETLYCP